MEPAETSGRANTFIWLLFPFFLATTFFMMSSFCSSTDVPSGRTVRARILRVFSGTWKLAQSRPASLSTLMAAW